MQSKKCYLALAVAAGILCAAAGGIEEPRFIGGDLIAPPNPALAGIEQLRVVITTPEIDGNKVGLDWEKLKSEVERKLQDAGIRIFVPKQGVRYEPAASADLSVYIQVLSVADLPQCVFCTQASLARGVCLKQDSGLFFKADVWKTEPVMQAVPVSSMPGRVSDLVRQQVEAFLVAYLAANPPGKQTPQADSAARAEQPKGESAAKAPALGQMYVASKNANAFHRPDCRWAKNISPSNLVGYGSRDEAIQAGKKPCKWCKP
jgi:hypothetical protein